MFWDKYLSKNKPDAIIGDLERIPAQTCQVVAKKFNIPYYIYNFSLPLSDRFYLRIPDQEYYLPRLQKYWKENKDKKLSLKQYERAKSYLDNERKKKIGHSVIKNKPIINLQKIKFLFWAIYVVYFVEKNKNPYMNVIRGIKNYFKRGYRYMVAKHLYKKPKFNEKIIFFPLHTTSDAAILLGAPHFKNQEFLIESISNSLPANYTLYVKEHPLLPGDLNILH